MLNDKILENMLKKAISRHSREDDQQRNKLKGC
jgi:hypothetical protein